MAAKPLDAKTRKRIAQVRLMTAQGHSIREITDHLVDAEEISERSARRVRQLADEEMEAEIKAKRQRLVSRQFGKLQHALRLALEEGNLPSAIAAIREQNKVLGLEGIVIGDDEQWKQAELVLVQRAASDSSPQEKGGSTSNGHTNGANSRLPYTPHNGNL